MFEHFNSDIGHNIHLIISWWTVLGFFGSSFMPSCNGNKKQALIQLIFLGPFFWIGVPLMGLYNLAKNKGLNNGNSIKRDI